VIALQEVENLDVLKRFRGERLKSSAYVEAMLVDGNDPRMIDVAVLSRFPIVAVRSHQALNDGSQPVFSRDCLEVDLDVKGTRLVLFVNHFKSMLDKKDPANGRKNTRAKRVKQAAAVKKLVEARFGTSPGTKSWAVLGDLNDFRETGQGTTSGILSLVDWSEVEDVLGRLPKTEQWTHFFDGAKSGEIPIRQLDYLYCRRRWLMRQTPNRWSSAAGSRPPRRTSLASAFRE
jgi:endonuclease/exonuclease/phosphatase family metal-dependent hydrolase